MTWAEAMGAFGRNGLDCGGHTVEHRVLNRIPAEDQFREIEGCAIALKQHGLWNPGAVFCYPAGRTTQVACRALGAAGFTAGVTAPSSQWTERLVGGGDDLALLSRLLIGSAMDDAAFGGNVAGLKALGGTVMRRRAAPPS
jgi:hypothetical protein